MVRVEKNKDFGMKRSRTGDSGAFPGISFIENSCQPARFPLKKCASLLEQRGCIFTRGINAITEFESIEQLVYVVNLLYQLCEVLLGISAQFGVATLA